jgi:hypothetical protein
MIISSPSFVKRTRTFTSCFKINETSASRTIFFRMIWAKYPQGMASSLIDETKEDMDSPEIREIINEIPHLSKLMGEGARNDSREKIEAERAFAEKYGTKYGTLDEFIAIHGSPSSSQPQSTLDPCTYYDPSEKKQYFDPSSRRQYVPRIVPSSKKTTNEFNIFDFLYKNLENNEEIVMNFLEYEPSENEDVISNSFLDICIQEMGKLGFVLNNSKELGYRIIEVQTQKSVSY